MGCGFSLGDREVDSRSQWQPQDVFIFVPGLRLPTTVNFNQALQGRLSSSLLDRLSNLRTRSAISGLAADGFSPRHEKQRRKKTSKQGGINFNDLQLALEEYLPVLLGLTREGGPFINSVEFGWTNQECQQKETVLPSALYELMSVLHMLAMVTLSQANAYLTPKPPAEGYLPKVAEGDKKAAIESLLKAAQVLECAINIIGRLPDDIRLKLPTDLKDGILQALQQQALGQGVEIQLGLAIDNVKASLAVKRRLACEQVKYWEQAEKSIGKEFTEHRWGGKHVLFVRWKLAEAKAAAYYYHGLILDEGQEENTHAKATACLQAAQMFLKDSQKASMGFSATDPQTRIVLPWGPMKYLTEKIPKDALSKMRVNRDVYRHEKAPDSLPPVPNFPLALKAEPFALPAVDAAWSLETGHHIKPSTTMEDTGVDHGTPAPETRRAESEHQKLVDSQERESLL